ncbi:uncharacterized protein BJ171DRAFT_145751 [Polychytrium aggregatum]|uniref:uncharacterized protein n=1 Tax=Polychytrium aggregatum TaxID=110093 RepID=UPI0022FF3F3B|nr:uncharacterized protein BJ171DRAFT_145751 [Polychytrium aggregatum]KAI9203553.1 hypothetical protein BJ171DRAFT_145751 [Polychytrium aggregatum]
MGDPNAALHEPPPSSLWHPAQHRLVGGLLEIVLRPGPYGEHSAEKKLTTKLLPILVSQFPPPESSQGSLLIDPSSRVTAVRIVLAALNYSLCIEDVASDLPRSLESTERQLDSAVSQKTASRPDVGLRISLHIRFLLLKLLVLFLKKLDRSKLQRVFASQPMSRVGSDTIQNYHPSSFPEIRSVIVQSATSLLDLKAHPFLLHKHKEIPQQTLKLWGMLAACLAFMVGGYDDIRQEQALVAAEGFAKAIFKRASSMVRKDYGGLVDQMKVSISLLGESSRLLPVSVHSVSPPDSVHLLGHPIIFLKHIVNPVMRVGLWSPECRKHSSKVLASIRALIVDFQQGWGDSDESRRCRPGTQDLLNDSVGEQMRLVSRISEYISKLSESLVETIDPIGWRGYSAQPGSSPLASLVLKTELGDWIATWLESKQAVVLLQSFAIPLLAQIGSDDHCWRFCENLIIRVYTGGLDKPDKLDKGNWTSTGVSEVAEAVAKWLLSTACLRSVDPRASISRYQRRALPSISIKLPSLSALINLRLMCIRLMAQISNHLFPISMCLLSLFDDPSYQIRLASAHALAIHSLNGDPCQHIVHREDGLCRSYRDGFSDPHSNDLVLSPLRHSLQAIFRELTEFWTSESEPVTTQECEVFGSWTYFVTAHCFAVCPFRLSQDFPVNLARDPGNPPGPQRAPPVRFAFMQFFTDLLHHLLLYQQTDSRQSAVNRLSIALVTKGAIEGTGYGSEAAPYCCLDALSTAIPLLWRLRRDSEVAVRMMCLETCASCIGVPPYPGSPDRMESPDGRLSPTRDPSVPESSQLADYNILSTLYDIVRGCPFASPSSDRLSSDRSDYGDPVDQCEDISALVERILGYGKKWHLAALYYNSHESPGSDAPTDFGSAYAPTGFTKRPSLSTPARTGR